MKDKKKVHNEEVIGRIFEILRILQEETDECHAISQESILEKMKESEHPCSLRSLRDDLKVMVQELNPEEADGFVDEKYTIDDYRIVLKGLEDKLRARELGLKQESTKKLQMRELRYNHLFSFAELNQMIEEILFSKSIHSDRKEQLIRKLSTLSSKHFPKNSPFISENTGRITTGIMGIFENSRTDEARTRENLKIIRDAIEFDKGAGCKISFSFKGYNEKKGLVPRRNADGGIMAYMVSPYYIYRYNGKYYLICCTEPYKAASIYRIDLMFDIKLICSSRRTPKRDVEGVPVEWCEKSAMTFQTEHMNMFYGSPCEIMLKLDRERYTLLHDYFGDNYEFKKHLDSQWDKVAVRCVPKAMESWAMQCSEYVEVIEPAELRESIRGKCEELVKRYGNNEKE